MSQFQLGKTAEKSKGRDGYKCVKRRGCWGWGGDYKEERYGATGALKLCVEGGRVEERDGKGDVMHSLLFSS